MNETRPTIDAFFELFLFACKVRGKDHIWIRTDQAREERRRMHQLLDFLCERCKEQQDSEEWRRFLIRARNTMTPGPTGSFGYFENILMNKTTWLLSINAPWYEAYTIVVSECTAQQYLEQADQKIRTLAEQAADVYMMDPKK